jgi:hypothetical protein
VSVISHDNGSRTTVLIRGSSSYRTGEPYLHKNRMKSNLERS